MTLERLDYNFSVCKVADAADIDLTQPFCFVGKTDEELSLVCLTEAVPASVTAREDGWRALRIMGTLDFSLIGILAGISAVLAAHNIGIFVISTYQTDYVLVRQAQYAAALQALAQSGHDVM